MSSVRDAMVNVPDSTHTNRAMYCWMLVPTFCWAANIVAGKEALLGFNPLALAQLRVAGAAFILGVLFVLRRGGARPPQTFREWLILAVLGLTGITLNQLCFIGGLARTSVVHTGLIVALGPVIVLMLAALMKTETLTLTKIVGMMLAFSGVALLLLEKKRSANGPHWFGDLIVLAGTVVFAYYTVLEKAIANRYDDLTLNTFVFGLGAVLMVPLAGKPTLAVDWHDLPLRAWCGLGFMIVFGSVIAYWVFAYALTELSPSRVAAFSYLEPVIAVALGIWLLGESVALGELMGGVLILVGMYLTECEGCDVRRICRLAHRGA